MRDLLGDVWHRIFVLPAWGKALLFFASLVTLDAIHMTWGESRFVGGFFESIVAMGFYWTPIVGIFLAIFWGAAVADKVGKKWIGWLVGLALFLAFGTVKELGKLIPGVGWRIEKMEAAREEAIMDY